MSDPVAEIALFWIAAHVVERQDGDGGPIGKLRCRVSDLSSLPHHTIEAIATTRNSGNPGLAALIVPEQFPESRDLHGQVAFSHRLGGPGCLKQIVLAYRLILPLD